VITQDLEQKLDTGVAVNGKENKTMKIYEIINEAEAKDTHCSDKCCGADTKAEDCTCPPSCEHCNCNNDKVKETATGGGTSAGSIASVSSVPGATRKIKKKGKYGAPTAPQATNPDGTAKNAQDMSANLMGGATARR